MMFGRPAKAGENSPLFPSDHDQGAHAQGTSEELARLREREREMMDLLGTTSPDRLIHDLRNLINEVHLLRIVADEKM